MNLEFLKRKDMSWKAKGLLTYLLNQDDRSEFLKKNLVKVSKDGYESMTSGFNELKKHGYLTSMPERDSDGRFETHRYEISDTPFKLKNNVRK